MNISTFSLLNCLEDNERMSAIPMTFRNWDGAFQMKGNARHCPYFLYHRYLIIITIITILKIKLTRILSLSLSLSLYIYIYIYIYIYDNSTQQILAFWLILILIERWRLSRVRKEKNDYDIQCGYLLRHAIKQQPTPTAMCPYAGLIRMYNTYKKITANISHITEIAYACHSHDRTDVI